jgi:hypothetical protein
LRLGLSFWLGLILLGLILLYQNSFERLGDPRRRGKTPNKQHRSERHGQRHIHILDAPTKMSIPPNCHYFRKQD